MWVCGLDWVDPGQRQVADAFECGNEPSGSVKCGEFLDQLQTSQLLKKDSAPWSKYGVRPLMPHVIEIIAVVSTSAIHAHRRPDL